MTRLISSIYARGPSAYAEERRQQVVAEGSRKAWRERGIAVLKIDDIRDDLERQMVINIANRLFGPRVK